MTLAEPHRKLLIRFCYISCWLLVIVYVNLFTLYTLIKEQLGTEFIYWAPLILPPVVLFYFLLKAFSNHSIRKKQVKWRWVIVGILFCVFALFIPDPAIAVKKIHVTEYLILSLLARYTISHNYSCGKLFLFAFLFTTLLGIHDEFLQGIHPSRTYGLRDMAVNIFSALGGSCIWHGLQLFQSDTKPEIITSTAKPRALIFCYLAWLITSVAGLAFPIVGYLNDTIPFWPTLPLVTSLILFVFYHSTIKNSDYYHGVSVLTYTSMLFLLYLPLAHVLQISFF